MANFMEQRTMIDCAHPNFDEGGVCTCCKEFYSADHDQNPNDIHPAMRRLIERAEEESRD